ncbi:MAG: HigA family addiction module antidote protein [Gammaproteobacteria bacterium]|nr:HigA family addiction module antidote protein [Gammaproteobacteria bacterium]
MVRLPSNRPPVHPGEILLKEYIKPYGLTQAEVARKIGVSAKKLSAVIHAVKAVDTDMALRLGKLFGTSPELWLNGQNAWDIWQASHNEKKQRTLKEIAPLKAHAVT